VTLTGLGQHWLASDPDTFDAHLIALRSIGTSTDIPGFLHPYTPLAVLRMGDGTPRAVADSGPTSHMLSESDAEYIHGVWEEVYPKLYATVSQDAYVMRRERVAGGHKGPMDLKKWEAASPKFNAMVPGPAAKYPLWGEDEESIAFETKHFHLLAKPSAFGNPRKWINPKDPEAQKRYRKCVMEAAENFWTYVEAAGASMPYWRLEGPNYKYIVQVRDSGYGGGGGWMHCGVGDIRPNVLGHEFFHSMPHGGWEGYFLETMCDSGMHTMVPGQLHVFLGNFCYPWRNVNRIAYKSSLWCFVLGDSPNWGYGIHMVLGSLAIGGIELSGDARVLEAATVSTTGHSRQNPGKERVRITGSAVIKGDTFVTLRGWSLEITDGVVIDYAPSFAFSGKGTHRHGRFHRSPDRNHKPDLNNGVDAGALYANWQFNQPKAVTLEDSYVNNNGVLHGNPQFAQDGRHQCITFNGTDQYAEVPPSVADFGEVTIDTLVHLTGHGDGCLFDFGTGEDDCFYLAMVPPGGKPVLTTRHQGKTCRTAASEGIPADRWVRVRVEMDGTTASIHVDGKQVAREACAFRPRMVFSGDRSEGNFIARRRSGDGFFRGRMDHFRIYRKVHDDFDAVPPVPFSLTQLQEWSEEDQLRCDSWEGRRRAKEAQLRAGKDHATLSRAQQEVVYHTTADWDDKVLDDHGVREDESTPKMREWLKDVRGY